LCRQCILLYCYFSSVISLSFILCNKRLHNIIYIICLLNFVRQTKYNHLPIRQILTRVGNNTVFKKNVEQCYFIIYVINLPYSSWAHIVSTYAYTKNSCMPNISLHCLSSTILPLLLYCSLQCTVLAVLRQLALNMPPSNWKIKFPTYMPVWSRICVEVSLL